MINQQIHKTDIMNDQQINDIAREYGEYVANSLDYDMCSDPELRHRLVVKGHSEAAQLVLDWLLRRFCLVEKEQVKLMYKEAIEGKCELEKMQPQNTYAKNSILMKVGMNAGCAYTLKSLFPEIAKEVEG